MHAVRTFLATGIVAQVAMVAALAATVGLSAAGWVVGVACAAVMNAALIRGVRRYRTNRLGPADWVTLARATLAVGVAALVADSFGEPAQVTTLVALWPSRSRSTRSMDGSRDAQGRRRRWVRTSTLRSMPS